MIRCLERDRGSAPGVATTAPERSRSADGRALGSTGLRPALRGRPRRWPNRFGSRFHTLSVLRPGLSAAILTDTSEGAEARLDELASALQADRAAERELLRTLIAAGKLRAVDEVAVMAVLGVALTTLSSAKPAMAALLGLNMDDAGSRERLAEGIADLLLHGLLPR